MKKQPVVPLTPKGELSKFFFVFLDIKVDTEYLTNYKY